MRNAAGLFLLQLVLAGGPFSLHSEQGQAHATQREPLVGAGLKRSRLYLKDGSFQVVLSYRVNGQNVFYLSAERGAEEEIIPLRLVDLPASEAWAKQRDLTERGASAVQLDPELAREEAAKAARSPEVAKDLRLPDEDAVLVLDTYRGQRQLVVLQQSGGALNHQTSHNVLRQAVHPLSSAHPLLELKGETASVQVHVPDPELYVRLESSASEEPLHAGAFRVSTGGNDGGRKPETPPLNSEYIIARVDVRRGVRIVTSFSLGRSGTSRRQADVIETNPTALPGGQWLKISPKEPLSFGEYALVEILDNHSVNAGVWDFGVRPTAGPNRDAILPEERRSPALAPRRAQP